MDILLQDIRYAARKLIHTPGFTTIAILTLSLAIGATTAVFSIVNGVLLEPLRFRDADQVMAIGSLSKEGKLVQLSAPDFVDYRSQTHSFVGMAAMEEEQSANLLLPDGEAERLTSARVGANFFDILGTSMELGRGFMKGEDSASARLVVVLSDKLWRERFSADRGVVGRAISINGKDYTVVGVSSPSLTYPSRPDLWTPLELEPWMVDPVNRGAHFLTAVGRRRAEVSAETARQDMATVGARLRTEYPKSNATFGGTAEELRSHLVGDVKPALFTMFGAVAFVLLIACANVANLMLVRGAGRETEMAVRTALGARRGRIVRQLVTESLLLSAAGAAIGGAIASWIVDAVVAFGPAGLPRLDDISMDARVLVFTAGVAIVTGILFGLVPALQAARTDLGEVLKTGMRGSSAGRTAQRTRGILVMTEIALAMVLLVGAGLLIRSFSKLLAVNPGFRAEQLVTFDVSLPVSKYPNDRDLRRFTDQLRAGLAELPGVQSVATMFDRPLSSHGMRVDFDIDGQPKAPADKRMLTDVLPATANYASTMGIPLIAGRMFTAAEENWGPPPVVVVNQALAKRYFPNENPIGKHITLGIQHDTAGDHTNVKSQGEIIGIVGDVHQKGLREDPDPATYLGWGTIPINDMSFVIRTRGQSAALATGIRERVREVDPTVPVFDVQTMDHVVAESVAQPRFYTALLAAFAGLALLLAALGIYGVISYSVSQRTRELGIRIALGATQERVTRFVLRDGLQLAVVGAAIGVVAATWLMRLLAAMLYGVGATDIATFAIVSVVLIGVAWLASYLPARRASRVDPVIAMRAE